MRSYLPDYEMRVPKDLTDALTLLAREPGIWKPFSGGTDLMVLFEAGKLEHKKFVSLWSLQEMKGIEATDTHVVLGGLTTYSEILKHPLMRAEFPMMCQAASETGAVAIQNRGTIAGNLANASPAADTPPVLLVHEAEIELSSEAGARWVSVRDFHQGYKKTAMRPDELITRVRMPRVSGFTSYYRKVGTRKAQAISKICFAGLLRTERGRIAEVRIALGSVAATPVRCAKTEAALRGVEFGALATHLVSVKQSLSSEIAPITDIRSTADYRLRVAQNLLEEFVNVGLDLRSS